MSLLPGFLLRIAKATSPPVQGVGAMSIIIRQPYSHLQKEMRQTFKGQEDAEVIVDKRYAERRTSRQPVAVDNRKADRRLTKEELVEVVLWL